MYKRQAQYLHRSDPAFRDQRILYLSAAGEFRTDSGRAVLCRQGRRYFRSAISAQGDVYKRQVSEAATAQNADGTYVVNGQNVLIPFIYKSTDNLMIQMLKQKNAGYSTADGSIELFNDTTTDLLYGIAGHVKSGAFSTFKISGYPANFLNAGQCIFAIDSTAGATWMGTDCLLYTSDWREARPKEEREAA